LKIIWSQDNRSKDQGRGEIILCGVLYVKFTDCVCVLFCALFGSQTKMKGKKKEYNVDGIMREKKLHIHVGNLSIFKIQ
jgi:hypothetical protein